MSFMPSRKGCSCCSEAHRAFHSAVNSGQEDRRCLPRVHLGNDDGDRTTTSPGRGAGERSAHARARCLLCPLRPATGPPPARSPIGCSSFLFFSPLLFRPTFADVHRFPSYLSLRCRSGSKLKTTRPQPSSPAGSSPLTQQLPESLPRLRLKPDPSSLKVIVRPKTPSRPRTTTSPPLRSAPDRSRPSTPGPATPSRVSTLARATRRSSGARSAEWTRSR
jgi:hypothetical protein